MRSVSAQAHIRKGDVVCHPGFRVVGDPRDAPLPDKTRVTATPPAHDFEQAGIPVNSDTPYCTPDEPVDKLDRGNPRARPIRLN